MPERLKLPDEFFERRCQKRKIMILRAGLIEQGVNSFFCLVNNVSSGGIRAKLYTSAARLGDVVVRVADEEPIPGQIIWIRDSYAGIAFDTQIRPETLLRLQQKLTPARRRSTPRVALTSYAALMIDGRIIQGVIRNISSLGARVTTSRALEVGERASMRLPDLPELKGYVRWTESPDSGLLFETPIPMSIISDWLHARPSLVTRSL